MKSRRWIFYPLLIAIFPVVSLYAQNAHWTPLAQLTWPMGLMAAGSMLVWLALVVVVRKCARAAMLAVIAVTVFSTIGAAPGWADLALTHLSGLWVMTPVHVWPPLLVTAELAIAAGLTYAVARLKRPEALTPALNVFAAILIAMPIVSIVRTQAEEKAELADTKRGIRPPGAVASAHNVGRRPDIFYIILDGYARS